MNFTKSILFFTLLFLFFACKKDSLLPPLQKEIGPVHERSNDCRNLSTLCKARVLSNPDDDAVVARVSFGGEDVWKINYTEMISGQPTLIWRDV